MMRRFAVIVFWVLAIATHARAQQTPALAIVVQDQTALRAAPKNAAPQQAVLWQGDLLELRGARLDYLQVYDHRRERAGFVQAARVRIVPAGAESAPDLLAVLRFLRDTPGAEALGIAYTAAYLKAAPPAAISAGAAGAEAFDALGTMADRLARRASTNTSKANGALIAAHLEVAASYGVVIASFDIGGRMQLCYDGEAFRRVLALPATDAQKARAALALTRPECVDPATPPAQLAALDAWRAGVLDRVPRTNLPEHVRNRLRLRSATIGAAIAFERARRGEAAQDAASLALAELAAVDKLELDEDDLAAYNDAAMRVGASRWAGEPAGAPPSGGLAIATAPRAPGETCVKLLDKRRDLAHPLLERCTFGIVWTNSVSANAYGTALALAVQPLAAWRELWLLHLAADGWRVDVLPPGDAAPDGSTATLGYIEFAGWVPGGRQLLAARELRSAGRFVRRFDVLDLETLAVARHADSPEALSVFYRWQDPAWKRQTVSLR